MKQNSTHAIGASLERIPVCTGNPASLTCDVPAASPGVCLEYPGPVPTDARSVCVRLLSRWSERSTRPVPVPIGTGCKPRNFGYMGDTRGACISSPHR